MRLANVERVVKLWRAAWRKGGGCLGRSRRRAPVARRCPAAGARLRLRPRHPSASNARNCPMALLATLRKPRHRLLHAFGITGMDCLIDATGRIAHLEAELLPLRGVGRVLDRIVIGRRLLSDDGKRRGRRGGRLGLRLQPLSLHGPLEAAVDDRHFFHQQPERRDRFPSELANGGSRGCFAIRGVFQRGERLLGRRVVLGLCQTPAAAVNADEAPAFAGWSWSESPNPSATTAATSASLAIRLWRARSYSSGFASKSSSRPTIELS